jgi:hypothetical protein
LLAKMTCGGQISSICRKRSILACLFSMMASMIKSHSFAGASSVVGLTLPMIASLSASVSFPLATLPARFFSMPPIPLATSASVMSRRTTSYPAAAATCAIPEPIKPAPITMILLISMFPPPLPDRSFVFRKVKSLRSFEQNGHGQALLLKTMAIP